MVLSAPAAIDSTVILVPIMLGRALPLSSDILMLDCLAGSLSTKR